MSHPERAFNYLLGLSVFSWAVLAVTSEAAEARPFAVRWTVAALHGVVGVMLVLRAPQRRGGSATDLLVSLPALIVAGWAMKVAPDGSRWPLHAEAVFVVGGTITLVAFLYLGRSFAILPALRFVVSRGPYRFVRHPAYVGELLLVGACALAAPSPATIAPFVVAIPTVVARVLAEERLLRSSRLYEDYAESVRWRLVPGVW